MNTLQELPTPIVLSYYYLIQCLAARLLCTKEWKMKLNMFSFIFHSLNHGLDLILTQDIDMSALF